MSAWVLFIAMKYWTSSGGPASFQYEFKDKNQCVSSLREIKNRFEEHYRVIGYCQEVRK